jgi:hypothetical protein
MTLKVFCKFCPSLRGLTTAFAFLCWASTSSAGQIYLECDAQPVLIGGPPAIVPLTIDESAGTVRMKIGTYFLKVNSPYEFVWVIPPRSPSPTSEVWRINRQTGQYQSYYTDGSSSLAADKGACRKPTVERKF